MDSVIELTEGVDFDIKDGLIVMKRSFQPLENQTVLIKINDFNRIILPIKYKVEAK